MTDDLRLLIECYRSGQISEAACQEHLEADQELRAMVDRPVDGGTRRPAILDMDIVVVPRDATDEMLSSMGNMHMPFGEMVAAYDGAIFASPYPTAWDDVRKYVEGLEESVAFTMTDTSRMLRKSDIKDVCPHPDDCFYEAERARCGPCAVKASKLAGIEIDDTHSHLPEVCRLRREVKAAEARIAELEKRLADAERVVEPFARLAGEYDPPEDDDNDLPFDLCHGDMTIGQLRAARAYMEGK